MAMVELNMDTIARLDNGELAIAVERELKRSS